MLSNKNIHSGRPLLAMMVILIYITGCVFTVLPLANAQIEETLSEESLARIHKSLDNIERTLMEMQVMIDDMTGKYDPGKAMITRDYFEEQMLSLNQKLVNATSSLTGRISSLREDVSSISDEVSSMETRNASRIEQFTRATAFIVLLYVGSIVWKYKEGLLIQSSEQTMIKEENNGEKGLIQSKTIV